MGKNAADVIALPQGGGALKGIGEKFSLDLHTGTGNFTVPIAVPPGRNGFQPQLSLTYSSGNGNGPFGLGWSLSVPGITRKTSKGIPRYRDSNPFAKEADTFILSGAEDLVPVFQPPTEDPRKFVRYRPRTEGLFARIDHVQQGTENYWQVTSKDGLMSLYGTPAVSEPDWQDPATIRNPAHPSQVFAWRLSQTTDTFGNRIVYDYVRDQSPIDGPFWDQLYLSRIRYVDHAVNNNPDFLVSIAFDYQERPDAFSDYRSGFEIRTRLRCKTITVTTKTDQARIVRSYVFTYVDERPELSSTLPANHMSLVSQIQMQGHDGETVESLPPVEFNYTQFVPGRQTFVAVTGTDLPPVSLSDPHYELVDLFGHGLPDLLEMSGTVRYWRNRGGGRFDRPREMASAPAGVQLGDQGVQLVDANGDGRLDLLVTQGTISGYYPLQFGGLWDQRSFQRYERAPSFDLKDPEVHLLDLTGDGVTDAVRSGTSLECFFQDPTGGWTERPLVAPRKALESFPNVPFSDPRVKWADLNGDGMQDIVLVHNGSINYWPNLGYGRWGARLRMSHAPRYPVDYDPQRILLGDIDGDGLADLVYVDHGTVTIWINQSGNGWSDKLVIRGTPSVSDLDSVRLVDLYGTGVAGLLWTAEARQTGQRRWFFLEFTGGAKPYLLNKMDNHIGATTEVKYKPSTYFYLLDEQERQVRWTTPLPFPVHVVSKVTSTDQFSNSTLTTEYRYHHGYWDGTEREFRGFGRVDQRDTQVFDAHEPTGLAPEHFSAPTETRTWFHQGPIGDPSSGWDEQDFSSEFWWGDKQVLERSTAISHLLYRLPRRLRRDALRTFRGRVLRTELYGLDGSDRQDRPYTVTESLHGLGWIGDKGGTPKLATTIDQGLPTADREFAVFFPHTLGERTTQWERGSDPMTQFTFTDQYDDYGFAQSQTTISVPRSAAAAPNHRHLATHTLTSYARQDDQDVYLVDRVAHTRSYDVSAQVSIPISDWHIEIVAGAFDQPTTLISQTLNFYDGEAFTGLPLGQLSKHGALVRTETLTLTEAMLTEAYANEGTPRLVQPHPYWTVDQPVSWPAEYPESFNLRLTAHNQSDPTRPGLTITPLGYGLHPGDDATVARGYFSATERRAYDFQQQAETARGLVMSTQDPLGHPMTMTYDPYLLLPIQVTDAAGLMTQADYDYRLLQPQQVIDPNGNRTEFQFSPLGLLQKKFVRGKEEQQEGDSERASLQLTYDFAHRPISVHSVRYVHHDTESGLSDAQRDDKIETIEFSDGFGRLLQTRTQAEAVLFGDSLYGSSGLPESLDQNGPAVGTMAAPNRPNVVVSGWQRYDNKGQVVEKFEPFFGTGWVYEPPAPTLLEKLQRITMYYDPRGQVIRTVNPDGSEQRVLYGVPGQIGEPDPTIPASIDPTPWETYTYDPNDLGSHEHRHTPGSVKLDGLGRTVRTVERNGRDQATDWYRTSSTYDIRGNVLTIQDQLGRQAFQHVYDLANRAVRTSSIDAGIRLMVYDAAGNEVERRDSKGAVILREYDVLNRPTRVWARDTSNEPMTLREQLIYGDAGDPKQPTDVRQAKQGLNLLGKLDRHYDEAGLLSFQSYDWKGNLFEKTRQVLKDEAILSVFPTATTGSWAVQPYRVSWQPATGSTLEQRASELLTETSLRTSTTYDALNRITNVTYPQDVEGPDRRKVLVPHYNRAGALDRVELNGDLYVERIAYNAKGQRILITYGNGLMTRYAYDPKTFRLHRLRTEPYALSSGADQLTYSAEGGMPLQDFSYTYDLVGNIVTIQDRTPGCGVLNNPDAATMNNPQLAALLSSGDALVRQFTYDPLYRLREATGRECGDISTPRAWSDEPRCGLNSPKHGTANQDNAPSLTALYRETYAYDPAGNMLSLQHGQTTAAWTRTFGMGGMTPEQWSEEWPKHVNGSQAWDHTSSQAPGNQLTHVGDNNPTTAATHVYDANGNLTAETSSRHFAWDHSDRLRAFFVQGENAEPSVHAQYFYDAAGQRVKKLVRKQGGQYEVTTYIDGLFEHDRRVLGSTVHERNSLHIMDDQKRIALVRIGPAFPDEAGTAVQYHLGDHLGSTSVVVDKAGSWINREEYFPYGETSFGSFGKKRYRYTGKERDEESGLNYHQARYYAPWTASWISADPRRPSEVNNLYVYSRNNPVSRLDKDGKESTSSNECIPVTATDNTSPVSRFVNQLQTQLQNGLSENQTVGREMRHSLVYNSTTKLPIPNVEMRSEYKLSPSQSRLQWGQQTEGYRIDSYSGISIQLGPVNIEAGSRTTEASGLIGEVERQRVGSLRLSIGSIFSAEYYNDHKFPFFPMGGGSDQGDTAGASWNINTNMQISNGWALKGIGGYLRLASGIPDKNSGAMFGENEFYTRVAHDEISQGILGLSLEFGNEAKGTTISIEGGVDSGKIRYGAQSELVHRNLEIPLFSTPPHVRSHFNLAISRKF